MTLACYGALEIVGIIIIIIIIIRGVKLGWDGKTSYFWAKCVNISKMVGDTYKVTIND